MDAKVKEFLEKAQANEREKFEKERDALLISLGLIEGDAVSGREYGPRYGLHMCIMTRKRKHTTAR